MMRIRSARDHDVEAITRLSSELGYPTTDEDVGRRWSRISAAEDHAVHVAATPEGAVVGWIHVFGAYRLESDPFAEIGGLVVSEAHRGRGIGRLLCEEASRWAHEAGFQKLRVRTRAEREATHRFYRHIGFRRVKTQEIFSIDV